MADHLTTDARSALMARIGPKNTRPEMIVRRLAHSLGYRFRLHRRDLPGSPDLVFPSRRRAIFVHGCWWHRHEGCPKAAPPKSNADFWNGKFDRNVARDAKACADLDQMGWKVLVVWECQTRNSADLADRLREFLEDPL